MIAQAAVLSESDNVSSDVEYSVLDSITEVGIAPRQFSSSFSGTIIQVDMYGFNTLSIPAHSSDQANGQSNIRNWIQRAVPVNTFERTISTSTSGYTLNGYGTSTIPDWSGNTVTLRQIMYNGYPTGYYQNNSSSYTVIPGATVYRLEAVPSEYYLSLNSSAPDRWLYFDFSFKFDSITVVPGTEYQFSASLRQPNNGDWTFGFPPDTDWTGVLCDVSSCSGLMNNCPIVIDKAMLGPFNLHISGSFTSAFSSIDNCFLTLAVYLPDGYSFSSHVTGNSWTGNHGSLYFTDSTRNIVSRGFDNVSSQLIDVRRLLNNNNNYMTDASGANSGLNSSNSEVGSTFNQYVKDTDTSSQYANIKDSLFDFNTNIFTQVASTSTLFASIVTGIWTSLGDFSSVLSFFLVIALISAIIGIKRNTE